jgi:transcriptional regulator with GAF, ATPase, and Fis domain
MVELLRSASRVARSKGTVLITGESGTGKERVASYIHQSSQRGAGPFVRVNCAALSETLLESELFGHERGAFTGAHKMREGRFELADGGTLLLDEIGEISAPLQAKLLRVLEEEEFERVGGTRTLSVDVRVIATTNRDLAREVAQGRFREDLYYRLLVHVLPLHIAPLRERRDDVLPLARMFAEHYARLNGRPCPEIAADAQERLVQWDWPGNVRELENVIQRAVVLLQGGSLSAGDLAALVNRSIEEIERVAILATLQSTNGNKTEAARRLGVTARTVSNKMKTWRRAGLLK